MAKKPPKVRFRDNDPLQDYFNDGRGNLYSVAKLIDEAKSLPIFEVPLAALNLGDEIWKGSTVYQLAFHVKQCMEADLSYPILLDWEGGIADGRHRVIRALAEGRRTIKARRMTWKPEPCRRLEDG